ncbi:uncharacterized protein LOC142931621 [Anarhichas minor]|uniref:uncharacterized protein LOC142931621 n=1 Tax=Anarhichas minor TaxID=65739 RepID=UPI003F73D4BF
MLAGSRRTRATSAGQSENMSKVQMLRCLVNQRLTAAAEEIFGVFERTIAEYEEELSRSKEENERQRKLLDAVFIPQLRLHRADVQQLLVVKEEQQEWSSSLDQQDPEPPHIKEEQEELRTSQEGEQLHGLEEADIKFSFTPVKSEDDEEETQYSQLYQRQTEQIGTEADGEDCGGPEPDRNSDTDNETEDSPEPETDDSDDWKQNRDQQSGSNSMKNVLDDDEEAQSSQLHQIQTQENREEEHLKTETDGEEARSDPDSPLQPAADETSHSSECETDDGRDWEETQESQSDLNHLQNNEVPVSDMDSNTGKTSISSSECAGSFNNKRNLKKHTKSKTGVKLFQCSVCGKRFVFHSVFKNHLTVHTGEKPFSCSVCGKTFARKGSLKRHMTFHTGKKPFSCSVCGRAFAHKGNLTQHMYIHAGEKPFSCSVCGKTFAQKGSLKRHMTIHAGEKPFSCSVCGKAFAHKGNLTQHMSIHTRGKLRIWMKTELVSMGLSPGSIPLRNPMKMVSWLCCKVCRKRWYADNPLWLDKLPKRFINLLPAIMIYNKAICKSDMDELRPTGKYDQRTITQFIRQETKPAPFGEYGDPDGWNGISVSAHYLTDCLLHEYQHQGSAITFQRRRRRRRRRRRFTKAIQSLFLLVVNRFPSASLSRLCLGDQMTEAYSRCELSRSKEENERQRKPLDAVFNPQLRLHRADVQQLLVVKEEQQEWSSSLDQEDPEPPHIKEDQEDPEPPHIKEEQEDPEPPHIKEDQEDPEPPHIKEDQEDPEPPHIKEEQEDPEPPHIKEDQEDPEPPHIKEDQEDPEPPHIKEEQEDPEPPHIKEEQEDPEPPHIKEEQEDPEPPHIKEEQEELWTSQEGEQLQGLEEADIKFTFTPVKSEDDEVSVSDSRCSAGEKLFSCSECGKSFIRNGILKKHMICHTGVKPFQCLFCGKTFSRKGTLTNHMIVHTGEKPFICSVCRKTFARKSNMKSHMSVHTRETVFHYQCVTSCETFHCCAT